MIPVQLPGQNWYTLRLGHKSIGLDWGGPVFLIDDLRIRLDESQDFGQYLVDRTNIHPLDRTTNVSIFFDTEKEAVLFRLMVGE